MSNRKRKSWKHLFFIFVGSFAAAAVVGGGSEVFMRKMSLFWASVFLLVVVLVNILFDIIGMAATAATEAPHHARAANRVFGAKQAVHIVRNADFVANFANDIVGDITGTVSGAMAATIVVDLIRYSPGLSSWDVWLNTFMLALVASVTVTGKAAGKTFAIHEANNIIAAVGGVLATVEKVTGWNFMGQKKRGGNKNGSSRKHS